MGLRLSQAGALSPTLCQLATERVGVHVVGERLLAADLDDGQQLAIAGLEVGVAADVDLLVREAELLPQLRDDGPRALAEVAAVGVVELDLRYG